MEMTELEKVIRGLEYCIKSEDCRGCIYWEEIGLHEGCHLNADALALLNGLLKEQEATIFKSHNIDEYGKHFICGVECGSCHEKISRTYHYCPYCGKAVEWE